MLTNMLNKARLMLLARLALFCAVTLSATCQAAAMRTPVPGVKPLLLEAIAHGEAHGVLVGDFPAYFKQHFGTDAPIEVDVRRISAHRQAGCARLSVRTRQARVFLPAQNGMPPNNPKTMEAAYQIDYCDFGDFPQGEENK